MSRPDIAALGKGALAELQSVIDGVDADEFSAFVDEIAAARRIVLSGVGREGLMMRALAMRLYHLGLDAHVAGDMTTPPVGDGDLFIVSAGPGWFASLAALAERAGSAGARIACVTAQRDGPLPALADRVLVLPAQTMADDQASSATSILPMGSLYEGAQYIAFELLVLALRGKIGETAQGMRARHTNLE